MAGDTESHLKGQHMTCHLQPLILSYNKDGSVWIRDAWRETGDEDFGKRTERVVTGIPVLSHPTHCSSHLLRETTPLWVASAWGEAVAPPPGRTLPHWWCLNLTAEYRVTRWRTEGVSHSHRSLVVWNRLLKARRGHHLTSTRGRSRKKTQW